jgi:hypothetical protein
MIFSMLLGLSFAVQAAPENSQPEASPAAVNASREELVCRRRMHEDKSGSVARIRIKKECKTPEEWALDKRKPQD